jgi:hypothetical protein
MVASAIVTVNENMDVIESGTEEGETACPPRLTLAMVADGVLAPARLRVG